jgi:DNA-binding NtrC family response regulator
VVEQDSSVLKLISKTLEAEGYRVLPAESKPAALELLRCWKRHIGLLVLDRTNGENEWPASSLSEVIPDVPMLEISTGNRTPSELHPRCKLLLSPFSSEQLRNAVNELKSSAASAIASECCA